MPSNPAATARRSAWPFRLALATLIAAVPLVGFGGTVTTLEEGMAIEGWMVLDPGHGDHFLLFYPLEKWFRTAGTFVEHTHRLFGTVVGLLAIATLVAAWVCGVGRGARRVALGALVAVCVQGAVGGLRVLENSPRLAFLHGALGQAVFVVLAASAVCLSPRWRAARVLEDDGADELARRGRTALLVAYVTVFLGAWLRHGSSAPALVAHVVGVLVSLGLLLGLAMRIQELGRTDLDGARKRLLALVGLQVLLGLASYWVVFFEVGPAAEGIHSSAFPTLHVLFGALLLAQTAGIALWARRAAPARGARPAAALAAGAAGAGGAA